MDKDVHVGEPEKRRSPRSGKRKKKEEAVDSSRDSSAQRSPIKRIKRKRGQSEPSSSKKKQKVSFKCAPYMLFDILNKLSDNQKLWVTELGFGALLRMPEVRLPKHLSLWLIDHVDWKRKCLLVRGRPINIKKQIKRLIDLPAGKFSVPPPQSANVKIRKPVGEEKELKDAEKSIQDFIVILLAIEDKDKFKRWFMFAVLCIYLAPTSGHIINRNYMPTLANVDLIKNMDWCSFIADYLIDGIKEYRESTAANVNVHGCIHILLLIYISVVKTEMIDLPKEGYLAEHVNTHMLSYLESIDKIFLDTGFTFGNLEVDPTHFETGDVSLDLQPVFPEVTQTEILGSNHMSPRMNSPTNPRADLADSCRTSNPSDGSMDIQKIIEKLDSEYSKKREEITKRWTKGLNNNMKKLETKWRADLAKLLSYYKQNNPYSNNSADTRTDLLDSGGSRIFRSDQNSNAQDTTSNLHSRPILNNEDVENTEHTLLIQDSTHADDMHSEGDVAMAMSMEIPAPQSSALLLDLPNAECPSQKEVVVFQGHKLQEATNTDIIFDPIAGQDSLPDQSPHPADEVHLADPMQAENDLSMNGNFNKHTAAEKVPDGILKLDGSPVSVVTSKHDSSASCLGNDQEILCHEPIGSFMPAQEGSSRDAGNDNIPSSSKEVVLPITSAGFGFNSVEVISRSKFETLFQTNNIYPPAAHDLDVADYGQDVMPGVCLIAREASQQVVSFTTCQTIGQPVSASPVINMQHTQETIGSLGSFPLYCQQPPLQDEVEQVFPSASMSVVMHSQSTPDIGQRAQSQSQVLCSQNESVAENCFSASSKQIGLLELENEILHGNSLFIAQEHAQSCKGLSAVSSECSSGANQDCSGSSKEEAQASDDGAVVESKPVSPVFTREELCVTEIPESPPSTPDNVSRIISLETALRGGEKFRYAGSANIAVKSRRKRNEKSESKLDGIAECVKVHKLSLALVNRTYSLHVDESIFRNTEARDPTVFRKDAEGAIKICIRGVHITEEEYVHSVRPEGHVSLNFMWLCCVAIMEDWGSRTRFIINPAIIRELMKPFSSCNHISLIKRFKKLPVNETEQFYLPVVRLGHWILIVISIVGNTVDIYDSLKVYGKDEDPYMNLWDTMGANFQEAYNACTGRKENIRIGYKKEYAKIHTQTNEHDCGFEVIRAIESHNGKTLMNYGKVLKFRA